MVMGFERRSHPNSEIGGRVAAEIGGRVAAGGQAHGGLVRIVVEVPYVPVRYWWNAGCRAARRVPGGESMGGPPRTEGDLSRMRFLTVAEVASLMRVSKMTVYRLVHSGDLSAVRVGRSFRVPEQAVQDYLREALPEHYRESA
jgi:excisionase family DNA binding protein